MGSLFVLSESQKGEYLPLGRRTSVIGRGENLPLQVRDDRISRKHLRIRFDQGQNRYLAEDMGSKNGVLINSRKIEDPTPLREGDRILIGNSELLFTEKDFDNEQNALLHFKKHGELERPTYTQE
ncbi:FHA domain-containing protein [Planctomycetota bacterium]